ncbi:hypothetical protein C8R44DRAFT_725130 [Mycena epipterygia]|nr:hypothetical protein C8R44DRAFT_725130 [Mycena epipterygia]
MHLGVQYGHEKEHPFELILYLIRIMVIQILSPRANEDGTRGGACELNIPPERDLRSSQSRYAVDYEFLLPLIDNSNESACSHYGGELVPPQPTGGSGGVVHSARLDQGRVAEFVVDECECDRHRGGDNGCKMQVPMIQRYKSGKVKASDPTASVVVNVGVGRASQYRLAIAWTKVSVPVERDRLRTANTTF